jgi:DNA-directed RNA polymerase sigma subunit (sigma70/sigma32)
MSEEVVKKQRTKRETVSRERIRQIQTRALGKLRRLMTERGYKAEDFFDTFKRRN